jgi:hypothetical protein
MNAGMYPQKLLTSVSPGFLHQRIHRQLHQKAAERDDRMTLGPDLGPLRRVVKWRFPNIWVPQTMVFPIDNNNYNHFFWGVTHHFGKSSNVYAMKIVVVFNCSLLCLTTSWQL